MQALPFMTPQFKKHALKFLVYFLAVAVTPLIAAVASLLVRGFIYSKELRPLFIEALTMIFWGVEALAFHFIRKKIEKRKNAAIEEYQPKERILLGDGIVEIPIMHEHKRKKTKEKRVAKPPMPRKNFAILAGICAFCILLVSAVIGFQVKPFYDLGKKFTGIQMFCRLGTLGKNIVKCIWTVGILAAAKGMADELFQTMLADKKPYVRWLIWSGIFLTFGIFDIFTSVVSYPMGATELLLAVVYFLCYLLFPAVYYFAEESKSKSYFLILLIYLC